MAAASVALVAAAAVVAFAEHPKHPLARTVFVIMSQSGRGRVGEETKAALMEALRADGLAYPHLVLLHKDLPDLEHGGWTFFPLFRRLIRDYGESAEADWFVFLDESCRLDPSKFGRLLARHRPEDDQEEADDGLVFVGRALQDREPTIIHHFDDPGREESSSGRPQFSYPDPASGFLMSSGLVRLLAVELYEADYNVPGFPRDFSIDPAFELAKVVRSVTHLKAGKAVHLVDDPELCSHHHGLGSVPASCATWRQLPPCQVDDGQDGDVSGRVEAQAEAVLFAVKTCQKFHRERLPVVQGTWGAAAPNVVYFSEVEDPEFGTIRPGNVSNTESGHCAKTEAILDYFRDNANRNDWDWLVVADDDTLFSVARTSRLLGCFDPDEPVALGERYGFQVASGEFGYDFPTGGAGMIFSRAAVSKLRPVVDGGGAHRVCRCPKADSPDDMHIGSCLANAGIPLTHVRGLHQARPDDYAPARVAMSDQPVISFHKFWMNDPLQVYAEWFKESDSVLAKYTASKRAGSGRMPVDEDRRHEHTEL